MTLTTSEKKVLAKSREVALKYDKGNIDKIEQIDKKLKATPPQEREGLINDLKILNKKKSMKTIAESFNRMFSKYELKVSDPPTQTPRDPPKPTLEKPKSTTPKIEVKSITPKGEPKKSLRGSKKSAYGAGAGAGAGM